MLPFHFSRLCSVRLQETNGIHEQCIKVLHPMQYTPSYDTQAMYHGNDREAWRENLLR